MDFGCGITFDILTHVLHGLFFEILLNLRYAKVEEKKKKKYIMTISKMDITLLYLQKEICTGIIICFTNNSYTIYT